MMRRMMEWDDAWKQANMNALIMWLWLWLGSVHLAGVVLGI